MMSEIEQSEQELTDLLRKTMDARRRLNALKSLQLNVKVGDLVEDVTYPGLIWKVTSFRFEGLAEVRGKRILKNGAEGKQERWITFSPEHLRVKSETAGR